MLADLKMFAGYAVGLRGYLRQPLTPEQCRRNILHERKHRAESFLRVLERGIYAQPRSPYRKLLEHAGIALGDMTELVRREGVEGALEKIYDAGVYVTLNEFKGRQPIRRGGLHIEIEPADFDNPLLRRHYEARTSGSRGMPRRILIDLDLLAHEAAYFQQFLTAFDLASRPIGSWRPVPLVSSGMKLVLRYAKLGRPVERWFSQTKLEFTPATWKYFLFTVYTVRAGRIFGCAMPMPEYVPLPEAIRVARWLKEKKDAGTPALLDTSASPGVRVCLAAKQHGLDISGTFFRLGGEPFTSAKAQVMADAGCRAVCHYSISEIGNVGMACADPADLDDVHLLDDKVAAIQRPKTVDRSGATVPALIYTTVLPSCPKLMLNVESDDYAIMERRTCGCPFGALGFDRHLRRIRSYEKLTSEGVSFLGTELLRLVEEVLPARFGGDCTDYQLVETEESGLTKVSILVSPRRGTIDETQVFAAVLALLRSYPGGEIMARHWEEAQTLRVLRREPYSTGSAKVMPLHILTGSP
jgi:hypothetical protein